MFYSRLGMSIKVYEYLSFPINSHKATAVFSTATLNYEIMKFPGLKI